jgi:hypothetical protein
MPYEAFQEGAPTMAKEIILYNLAPHVTDEEFQEYVDKEKGPLIDALPSVSKYELVKITDSASGEIPYRYVGIVHLSSLEDFQTKDATSESYQAFRTKFRTMVSDMHVLFGEEIH